MIVDYSSFFKGILIGFIAALIIAVIVGLFFIIPMVANAAQNANLPSWIPFV